MEEKIQNDDLRQTPLQKFGDVTVLKDINLDIKEKKWS